MSDTQQPGAASPQANYSASTPLAPADEGSSLGWWIPGASKQLKIGVFVAVVGALLLVVGALGVIVWRWRRRGSLLLLPPGQAAASRPSLNSWPLWDMATAKDSATAACADLKVLSNTNKRLPADTSELPSEPMHDAAMQHSAIVEAVVAAAAAAPALPKGVSVLWYDMADKGNVGAEQTADDPYQGLLMDRSKRAGGFDLAHTLSANSEGGLLRQGPQYGHGQLHSDALPNFKTCSASPAVYIPVHAAWYTQPSSTGLDTSASGSLHQLPKLDPAQQAATVQQWGVIMHPDPPFTHTSHHCTASTDWEGRSTPANYLHSHHSSSNSGSLFGISRSEQYLESRLRGAVFEAVGLTVASRRPEGPGFGPALQDTGGAMAAVRGRPRAHAGAADVQTSHAASQDMLPVAHGVAERQATGQPTWGAPARSTEAAVALSSVMPATASNVSGSNPGSAAFRAPFLTTAAHCNHPSMSLSPANTLSSSNPQMVAKHALNHLSATNLGNSLKHVAACTAKGHLWESNTSCSLQETAPANMSSPLAAPPAKNTSTLPMQENQANAMLHHACQQQQQQQQHHHHHHHRHLQQGEQAQQHNNYQYTNLHAPIAPPIACQQLPLQAGCHQPAANITETTALPAATPASASASASSSVPLRTNASFPPRKGRSAMHQAMKRNPLFEHLDLEVPQQQLR